VSSSLLHYEEMPKISLAVQPQLSSKIRELIKRTDRSIFYFLTGFILLAVS
jgi:hypothetical protein